MYLYLDKTQMKKKGKQRHMDNLFIRTKAEIKTVQTINIPVSSIKEILKMVQQDNLKDIYWKNPKINLSDLDSETWTSIKKNFLKMWSVGSTREDTETIQYIIRLLGFDGIENFGLYDEHRNCISMVVFNYGDHLN